MRNDICILVLNYAAEAEIKKKELQVFCSRKYYAAYAVGLKPKFVLEIDPMDWESLTEQGEYANKVIYKGAEYNILRDYQTNESSLELTVG